MFNFLRNLFKPTLWKCSTSGLMYTPTKGELRRLRYWGVSGSCGCPKCNEVV